MARPADGGKETAQRLRDAGTASPTGCDKAQAQTHGTALALQIPASGWWCVDGWVTLAGQGKAAGVRIIAAVAAAAVALALGGEGRGREAEPAQAAAHGGCFSARGLSLDREGERERESGSGLQASSFSCQRGPKAKCPPLGLLPGYPWNVLARSGRARARGREVGACTPSGRAPPRGCAWGAPSPRRGLARKITPLPQASKGADALGMMLRRSHIS